MINKIYERIKKFITDTYITFTFYLVLIATLTYQLPYYIITGGGVINTSDRISVNQAYLEKGAFYFSYVSELNATIPTFLLAKFNHNWVIEKQEEYQLNENETISDIEIRDKLYMLESNTNAIYNAYKLSGYDITLLDSNNYVIYIDDYNKTELKIGDIIKNVNGINISNISELKDIIGNCYVGENVNIEILRDNKSMNVKSEVYLKNNNKMLGISFISINNYDVLNDVDLKFNGNESGPSAGIMLALSLYNKLTDYDLTNGLKIVGTGTMENDGSVGEIGGVKYKFKGAIKNGADIFIVPTGENYDEVLKLKNENGYDITLIEAKNLEQVVAELKNSYSSD